MVYSSLSFPHDFSIYSPNEDQNKNAETSFQHLKKTIWNLSVLSSINNCLSLRSHFILATAFKEVSSSLISCLAVSQTTLSLISSYPWQCTERIPLPLFRNDRYNNKNWNLSLPGIRLTLFDNKQKDTIHMRIIYFSLPSGNEPQNT